MSKRIWFSAPFHCTTSTLAVVTAVLASASPALAQDATALYQKLRAIEATFPRIPSENILIGSFDGITGKFHGRVSTVEPAAKDCSLDSKGKPKCTAEISISTPPVILSRAQKVALVFGVTHPQGTFTATVNGNTTSVPATATSIIVPVTGQPAPDEPTGARWIVSWRVRTGAKSYSDSLIIDRMSFGIGAFTIPVLPVAIVYDPPQDNAHDDIEVFSTSSAHGSTVSISLSTQNGYGVDVPTIWTSTSDMIAGVKAASDLVTAAAKDTTKPNLDTLSKVLSGAASALPSLLTSSTAGQQDTKTVVNGTTHRLIVSTGKTYKSAQLGPGKGDVIVLLKNLRVGWFYRCCQPLSLVPLGSDLEGANTVTEMQEDLAAIRTGTRANGLGAHSHLDSLAIRALLALDPFVGGGNNAALPSQRFDSLGWMGLNGVPRTKSWVADESQIQQLATTKVSERIEKDEAGLLSGDIGGWGPDSSGTLTTTITHTNLTEESTQLERKEDLTLGGPGLDTSVVSLFYDRVFGSHAARLITPGPDQVSGDIASESSGSTASSQTAQPTLAGRVSAVPDRLPRVAASPSGVAGRLVTLRVGGRVYLTTTDTRGHYVFRLPHQGGSASGTVSVEGSSAPKGITLTGSRLVVPLVKVP
jgi:hypothetical protein